MAKRQQLRRLYNSDPMSGVQSTSEEDGPRLDHMSMKHPKTGDAGSEVSDFMTRTRGGDEGDEAANLANA